MSERGEKSNGNPIAKEDDSSSMNEKHSTQQEQQRQQQQQQQQPQAPVQDVQAGFREGGYGW
jgi:hypothetical protein